MANGKIVEWWANREKCCVAMTDSSGTKRKCRNAGVFPELEVDRLCHPPVGHGGP
jgi:hypothetical protein